MCAILNCGLVHVFIITWHQALVLKPDFVEAYNNIGVIFSSRGQLNAAAAAWREGAKASALSDNAHMQAVFENNQGFLLQKLASSSTSTQMQLEALRHFEAALLLHPSYTDAQTNRGLALFKLGRLHDSLEAYKRAGVNVNIFAVDAASSPSGQRDLPTHQSQISDLAAQPWAKVSPSTLLTFGSLLFAIGLPRDSARALAAVLVHPVADLELKVHAANNAAKVLVQLRELPHACVLCEWVLSQRDSVKHSASAVSASIGWNNVALAQATVTLYNIYRTTCYWHEWWGRLRGVRDLLVHNSTAHHSLDNSLKVQKHQSSVSTEQLLTPYESLFVGSLTGVERRVLAQHFCIGSEVPSSLKMCRHNAAWSRLASATTNQTGAERSAGLSSLGRPLLAGYISVDFRQHVMCYLSRSLFRAHRRRLSARVVSAPPTTGTGIANATSSIIALNSTQSIPFVLGHAFAANSETPSPATDPSHAVSGIAHTCRDDVKAAAVTFTEVHNVSAVAFGKIVANMTIASDEARHSDGIRHTQPLDVVVDLMGHTTGARRDLVSGTSLCPSTTLINYLGYPGTTGGMPRFSVAAHGGRIMKDGAKRDARHIVDFAMVDRWVAPPEHSLHFSEKLLVLPSTYQVNDHLDEGSRGSWKCTDTPDHSKSDFQKKSSARGDATKFKGAELSPLVACNLNRVDKLQPETLRAWANILRRVPKAVLWLLKPKRPVKQLATSTEALLPNCDTATRGGAENNLAAEFAAAGVSPRRLQFKPRGNRSEYMSYYCGCDVFLDSVQGYGAHTTATDALFMGVPVVTLQGMTSPAALCCACMFGGLIFEAAVERKPSDACIICDWLFCSCLGPHFASRVASSLCRAANVGALVAHSVAEYEDAAVTLLQSPALRNLAHSILMQGASPSTAAALFDTATKTSHIERAFSLVTELRQLQLQHTTIPTGKDGRSNRDWPANLSKAFHVVVGKTSYSVQSGQGTGRSTKAGRLEFNGLL